MISIEEGRKGERGRGEGAEEGYGRRTPTLSLEGNGTRVRAERCRDLGKEQAIDI